MAFKKSINDLIGILALLVLTTQSLAANIDCNGKPFHCLNSTHFMICVDLGSGVSSTIDDFVIPCPPTTVCKGTNRFECEFVAVTTTTTTIAPSVVPVTSVSESTTPLYDATISIPFEEYYNTLSTTTLSEDIFLTKTSATEPTTQQATDMIQNIDVIISGSELNSSLNNIILSTDVQNNLTTLWHTDNSSTLSGSITATDIAQNASANLNTITIGSLPNNVTESTLSKTTEAAPSVSLTESILSVDVVKNYTNPELMWATVTESTLSESTLSVTTPSVDLIQKNQIKQISLSNNVSVTPSDLSSNTTDIARVAITEHDAKSSFTETPKATDIVQNELPSLTTLDTVLPINTEATTELYTKSNLETSKNVKVIASISLSNNVSDNNMDSTLSELSKTAPSVSTLSETTPSIDIVQNNQKPLVSLSSNVTANASDLTSTSTENSSVLTAEPETNSTISETSTVTYIMQNELTLLTTLGTALPVNTEATTELYTQSIPETTENGKVIASISLSYNAVNNVTDSMLLKSTASNADSILEDILSKDVKNDTNTKLLLGRVTESIPRDTVNKSIPIVDVVQNSLKTLILLSKNISVNATYATENAIVAVTEPEMNFNLSFTPDFITTVSPITADTITTLTPTKHIAQTTENIDITTSRPESTLTLTGINPSDKAQNALLLNNVTDAITNNNSTNTFAIVSKATENVNVIMTGPVMNKTLVKNSISFPDTNATTITESILRETTRTTPSQTDIINQYFTTSSNTTFLDNINNNVTDVTENMNLYESNLTLSVPTLKMPSNVTLQSNFITRPVTDVSENTELITTESINSPLTETVQTLSVNILQHETVTPQTSSNSTSLNNKDVAVPVIMEITDDKANKILSESLSNQSEINEINYITPTYIQDNTVMQTKPEYPVTDNVLINILRNQMNKSSTVDVNYNHVADGNHTTEALDDTAVENHTDSLHVSTVVTGSDTINLVPTPPNLIDETTLSLQEVANPLLVKTVTFNSMNNHTDTKNIGIQNGPGIFTTKTSDKPVLSLLSVNTFENNKSLSIVNESDNGVRTLLELRATTEIPTGANDGDMVKQVSDDITLLSATNSPADSSTLPIITANLPVTTANTFEVITTEPNTLGTIFTVTETSQVIFAETTSNVPASHVSITESSGTVIEAFAKGIETTSLNLNSENVTNFDQELLKESLHINTDSKIGNNQNNKVIRHGIANTIIVTEKYNTRRVVDTENVSHVTNISSLNNINETTPVIYPIKEVANNSNTESPLYAKSAIDKLNKESNLTQITSSVQNVTTEIVSTSDIKPTSVPVAIHSVLDINSQNYAPQQEHLNPTNPDLIASSYNTVGAEANKSESSTGSSGNTLVTPSTVVIDVEAIKKPNSLINLLLDSSAKQIPNKITVAPTEVISLVSTPIQLKAAADVAAARDLSKTRTEDVAFTDSRTQQDLYYIETKINNIGVNFQTAYPSKETHTNGELYSKTNTYKATGITTQAKNIPDEYSSITPQETSEKPIKQTQTLDVRTVSTIQDVDIQKPSVNGNIIIDAKSNAYLGALDNTDRSTTTEETQSFTTDFNSANALQSKLITTPASITLTGDMNHFITEGILNNKNIQSNTENDKNYNTISEQNVMLLKQDTSTAVSKPNPDFIVSVKSQISPRVNYFNTDTNNIPAALNQDKTTKPSKNFFNYPTIEQITESWRATVVTKPYIQMTSPVTATQSIVHVSRPYNTESPVTNDNTVQIVSRLNVDAVVSNSEIEYVVVPQYVTRTSNIDEKFVIEAKPTNRLKTETSSTIPQSIKSNFETASPNPSLDTVATDLGLVKIINTPNKIPKPKVGESETTEASESVEKPEASGSNEGIHQILSVIDSPITHSNKLISETGLTKQDVNKNIYQTDGSLTERSKLPVTNNMNPLERTIEMTTKKMEDNSERDYQSITNIELDRYIPKPVFANNNTLLPTVKSVTNSRNFVCKLKNRGRFSDSKDCRKFYICIGKAEPIEGFCPNNTVFSELRKQCTKNLSHCVRNNQFQCVWEGRFSDYLNDNIYYICAKNNVGTFIRFKLQCQSGYHLNKTSAHCELNTESSRSTSQQSNSDVSKNNSDQSLSSVKSEKLVNESSNKFECKKEGKFPDADNCRKYYVCTKIGKSQYRRKSKTCDSDELFHKDRKKCVDADNYECS